MNFKIFISRLSFMQKFISLLAVSCALLPAAYSQQMGYSDNNIDVLKPFKISSGDNVLKIGTTFSSYIDVRDYPAGATADRTKNTLKLKDARLDIKGKISDKYEYHLQMDFGSWGTTYSALGGPLVDANFSYKGFPKLFNINVGYAKVPYSLSSLVEHYESPYWERPQIAKGDFMSRRDLGIKLYRSFWNERIKAAAGVYTGVGEAVLGGSNDPSGSVEYIARTEISYPENHNEEIVDIKGLTTPNVSIGLNGRYSKRNLPAGTTFLPDEKGKLVNTGDSALNFKVVDGEKYILGADISLEYRHFSLQFEVNRLKGTPNKANDPLLLNLPKSSTGGYFKAGGWYGQANYFLSAAKSILSVRYDELNANDLVQGISKHFAAGISYQVRGYNSMIKATFDHNLQFNATTLKFGAEPINTSKWRNEFRIGWQLVID